MSLRPRDITQMALLSVLTLAACTKTSNISSPQDVNSDDESSGRRRQATAADDAWTIYIGGCTASLVSPDILITANHCHPQAGSTYSSGTALAAGQQGDLTSTQVLEASPDLDYALVQVQWNSGAKPAGQLFPPKIATQPSDINVSQNPDQGDDAFTVGFPGDKLQTWGATYSEGQLKASSDGIVYYNLGVINGNSGGGVWRKSDKMLVCLTNNGPHQLGQDGWNQGDANDPNSWNQGPAMWAIYAQSQTLQDIFPNGVNRFGDITGGSSTKPPAQLGNDVYVLIEETTKGTDFLWVAIADNLDHPLLCANQGVSSCSNSDYVFDLKVSKGGRKLFRAETPASLSDGLQLAVVGADTAGTAHSGATLQIKAVQ